MTIYEITFFKSSLSVPPLQDPDPPLFPTPLKFICDHYIVSHVPTKSRHRMCNYNSNILPLQVLIADITFASVYNSLLKINLLDTRSITTHQSRYYPPLGF
eukprot:TRINITY_DN889_c0_g1_i1.p1 TRINITY_DN889_c0_g1~~TRINITY_DN889_c0_g1_i1.p1  ORF type:complete len:101 (+),score=2.64 TRINITY_DN889_c0_g1_i1:72-374(+)